MAYLIDGHNLVFAIRGFGEEFAGMDEEVMCAVMNEYFSRIRDDAFVIFDGTGPVDKSYFYSFSNLSVKFSGEDYEADDIVIDEIEADSAPRRLVVVSSDRKLRFAASKRRSTSLSSDEFWLMVVENLNRPVRKKAEPKEKRSGITAAETDDWMRIFGI